MNVSADHGRLIAIDVGVSLGLVLALGAVFTVDLATGANKPVVDVVFMLDEGGGLRKSADQIKGNWLGTAESLSAQGFDCRFAVIPCPPQNGQVPRISFVADVEEFKRRLTVIDSHPTQVGDDWPETDSLKALDDALKLDFRDDASPVVYLTTNDMFDDQVRLSQLADQYRERGVKAIIQAHESEQDFFRPLYNNGGKFYTLAGEDRTEKSDSEADQGSAEIVSLVSNVSRDTTDQLPQTEQFVAGVRVKGKIALVCDISGSMSRDFPPLVNELRSNFPVDTPLILVVGCHFDEPNSGNHRPIKLSESGASQHVLGVDLSNDRHVYYATNTTDAVILAIKYFRRDTVMFNNDLQDGGSMRAIEAFEDLWKKRAFTLSGRSLNCDAPRVLRAFIGKSGGDFKMDPISRVVRPATEWTP